MLICDQAPVSLEQDRMLDRLGDVMTFGCLEKCLECNGGQLVYQVAPRVKSFCVSVFLNLAKISRFFKNKMVPVAGPFDEPPSQHQYYVKYFCFMLQSGQGYRCQGDLSEWTKCQVVTINPSRKPFKVPLEFKEKYNFL